MVDPKKLVAINQVLEIQKVEDFINNTDKFYSTRIEEITEKGIVIGTPIEKSMLVNLQPGSSVILWYNLAAASYALFCQVKARIYEPLPLTFLSWPHDIQKIQRRNYVRVPVSLEVNFSVGERDANGQEIYHSARTSDLSGGGICFSTSVKLRKNAPMKIFLHLPCEGKIALEGEVSWVVSQSYNKNLIGIHFTKINEKIREKIISFVFIRQRDLINKGVLDKDLPFSRGPIIKEEKKQQN